MRSTGTTSNSARLYRIDGLGSFEIDLQRGFVRPRDRRVDSFSRAEVDRILATVGSTFPAVSRSIGGQWMLVDPPLWRTLDPNEYGGIVDDEDEPLTPRRGRRPRSALHERNPLLRR